jgi:cytochrome c peroxidase
VGQVATARHPWAVAMAPDGAWAAVGGIVPQGPATRADAASAITLIDLGARSARAQVPLPPGSSNLRGLAVTADGGLLLATHTIGRTSLPTTQLERGWVNTNAVTLIRMPQGRILATLLLDQVDRGAADPWGVALDRDGVAWIGIAGAHRLARLDLPALRRLLAGDASLLPPVPPRSKTPDAWAFWRRLATDPAEIERLAYDMTALHVAGFVRLWDLPVLGPRGIGVLPDGRVVAAGAFSGALALFDPQMPTAAQTLPLGAQAPETPARRGEFLFYDGIHCFQSWLSCSTCHHDTRSDGLVWDLLNDGLGNPKNSKSMLWAMQTEPAMWRGVRASGAVAVRAGFRFQMTTPPEEDVQAVTAYLTGLRPERSPHQVRQADGTWGQTPAALRGQAIFNDSTVGCTDCHDGPYRSDMRLHDVGTHSDGDPDGRYVTPPLDELWRSGPWLHDGRAARVRDIFTEHNPNDRHGRTRHLSAAQLDDLEAYLLSW